MARFQTKIEVVGAEGLNRGFNQIIEEFRDFGDVWKEIKPVLFDIEKRLFDSEGGSGAAGKWKELTEPYAEVKAKRYGNKPILEATGDLRASLTSDSDHTIFETTADSLTFGSDLPEFRGAMKGNSKKNVPARPAISFTDVDKQRIGRTMRKKLVDNIKKKTNFEVKE